MWFGLPRSLGPDLSKGHNAPIAEPSIKPSNPVHLCSIPDALSYAHLIKCPWPGASPVFEPHLQHGRQPQEQQPPRIWARQCQVSSMLKVCSTVSAASSPHLGAPLRDMLWPLMMQPAVARVGQGAGAIACSVLFAVFRCLATSCCLALLPWWRSPLTCLKLYKLLS